MSYVEVRYKSKILRRVKLSESIKNWCNSKILKQVNAGHFFDHYRFENHL